MSCEKISIEIIKTYLCNFHSFIKQYQVLINAHAINFLTHEHWNLIPDEMQKELLSLTDEELKLLPEVTEFLESRERVVENNITKNDYLEKLSCCLEHEDVSSTERDSTEVPCKCSDTQIPVDKSLTEFLQSIQGHRLEALNVVTSLDELEHKLNIFPINRNTNTDGNESMNSAGRLSAGNEFMNSAGRLSTGNEFMNKKKSHEIEIMSSICSGLHDKYKTDLVVDIGSGKGYLGTHLASYHNILVVGIDSSSGNTSGAKKRSKLMQKHQKIFSKTSFQGEFQVVQQKQSSDQGKLGTREGRQHRVSEVEGQDRESPVQKESQIGNVSSVQGESEVTRQQNRFPDQQNDLSETGDNELIQKEPPVTSLRDSPLLKMESSVLISTEDAEPDQREDPASTGGDLMEPGQREPPVDLHISIEGVSTDDVSSQPDQREPLVHLKSTDRVSTQPDQREPPVDLQSTDGVLSQPNQREPPVDLQSTDGVLSQPNQREPPVDLQSTDGVLSQPNQREPPVDLQSTDGVSTKIYNLDQSGDIEKFSMLNIDEGAVGKTNVNFSSLTKNKKPGKGKHKDSGKRVLNYFPQTFYIDKSTELWDVIRTSLPENISDATGLHVDDKLSHKVPNILLTGLHTCGDLASNIVKIFLKEKSVRVLCYVGCCYHLMKEQFLEFSDLHQRNQDSSEYSDFHQRNQDSSETSDLNQRNQNVSLASDSHQQNQYSSESSNLHQRNQKSSKSSVSHESNQDSSEFGFPLSDTLIKNKCFLGRTALNLAVQSPCRIKKQDSELQGRTFFKRALLQKIVCDLFGEDTKVGGLRNVDKNCATFSDYVRKAFVKLGFPTKNLSEELLSNYFDKYNKEEKKLAAFFQLRAALAPCIETLILLDRFAFLLEQDMLENVFLVRLFDAEVSPRCYGFVAIKK
ncbi:probable methyltransferase-like protein 25 [Patella vulgata]|uniref:probable methyltransferase-like protein 25 n=1 Tax=Patella vulgata TaxID=6465 RepID=UPI0024A7CD25|nr:probable methyltransferase-like protein 25 [Patella vulgata]